MKVSELFEASKSHSEVLDDIYNNVAKSSHEDIDNASALAKRHMVAYRKAGLKAKHCLYQGIEAAKKGWSADEVKADIKKNVRESLTEGMWVVKSKDGVEKRFKDADSAEAKAWKEKVAKKPTVPKEKFSKEWWDYQWDKDNGYGDKVFPWTKIDKYDLDNRALEAAVKDAGFSMKNVDDFTVGKSTDKKIGGVDCAAVVVRVSYSFSKEDDMGIDSDEPVSDAQSIYVARDPKNPTKYVFAGYAH